MCSLTKRRFRRQRCPRHHSVCLCFDAVAKLIVRMYCYCYYHPLSSIDAQVGEAETGRCKSKAQSARSGLARFPVCRPPSAATFDPFTLSHPFLLNPPTQRFFNSQGASVIHHIYIYTSIYLSSLRFSVFPREFSFRSILKALRSLVTQPLPLVSTKCYGRRDLS